MLDIFKRNIKVPKFQQYFASESNMNREQMRFYSTWVKKWNKGIPLDVQGNISYLFCYAYKVLALPHAKAVSELTRLIDTYPNESKFIDYCKLWLSDCYVLSGDYRNALDVYPRIPLNSRSATMTDDILSLKLYIGEHIAGRDVITLNGPKVTKWGKEHIDEVANYIDIIIRAYENHNDVNLLETWKTYSHSYSYSVFRGTFFSSAVNLPCYSFSRNDKIITFVREKTRDAENCVREEMGIPRVGEGWVAETELYYEIRSAFPNTKVLHHGCPKWLGRQHLDVFIPEYDVALEFQGDQHNKPVEYFGGEEAYRATLRRDARKKRMCKKNGVRLLEVHPGYNIKEVIQMIRNEINVSKGSTSNV